MTRKPQKCKSSAEGRRSFAVLCSRLQDFFFRPLHSFTALSIGGVNSGRLRVLLVLADASPEVYPHQYSPTLFSPRSVSPR